MKPSQWDILLRVISGEKLSEIPVAFIIDSPWLPGWAGRSTLDYYASDRIWLEANLKVVSEFPDIIFLPGFWSEFGMCSEPSAFGARCLWYENNLPHAEKVIHDLADVHKLSKPNVRTDGLLPLIIGRLRTNRPAIEQAGHAIKFAVARGPLNIASFLLGTTELMMGMMTDPEKCHRLISLISDFLIDWIEYQMEQFPTIQGILLLDDLIGFLGDDQCREYVVPYFKKIYGRFDADINFLHNDAAGKVSAGYLEEMKVHLFNFSFEHGMGEMRELAGDKITLLGNIPPRDILAGGTPQDVIKAVDDSIRSLNNRSRIILSCGGGMPQGVSTENIRAFADRARNITLNPNSERV